MQDANKGQDKVEYRKREDFERTPRTAEELIAAVDGLRAGEVHDIYNHPFLMDDVCRRLLALEAREVMALGRKAREMIAEADEGGAHGGYADAIAELRSAIGG